MASLKFSNIKKYHISLFSTNIFAIVLAIFFIKSYISKNISILPIFLIVLTIFIVFILVSFFVLKPSGKIKNVLPSKNFILINMSIAIILGLLFLKQIALFGFLFTLVFAFFLFELEHLIYESIGR